MRCIYIWQKIVIQCQVHWTVFPINIEGSVRLAVADAVVLSVMKLILILIPNHDGAVKHWRSPGKEKHTFQCHQFHQTAHYPHAASFVDNAHILLNSYWLNPCLYTQTAATAPVNGPLVVWRAILGISSAFSKTNNTKSLILEKALNISWHPQGISWHHAS